MAYNAVPTKAEGDNWTAAEHNTYVKDNFAAGVPDIFTAKGDIAVATGANVAVPLAVGSTYQFIIADSNQTEGIDWANMAVGQIVGGVETVGGGASAWTLIDAQSSEFDPNSIVSTGRFTAPATGYYLVGITARAIANNAENDELRIAVYIDGAIHSKTIRYSPDSPTSQYTETLSFMDVVYLAATSYVEFFYYVTYTSAFVSVSNRFMLPLFL